MPEECDCSSFVIPISSIVQNYVIKPHNLWRRRQKSNELRRIMYQQVYLESTFDINNKNFMDHV